MSDTTSGSDITWGGVFDAVGGVAQGLGTAYSDLMAAQGAKAEAGTYGQAAVIAGQDIDITKAATAIRAHQTLREELKVLGQQPTAEEANGLNSTSGTASDLLREAHAQGGLAQSMINYQGQITENGYRAEQIADLAKQQAAQQAAKSADAGAMGGIFKTVMSVAPLLLAL